jgi:hypothetical protein
VSKVRGDRQKLGRRPEPWDECSVERPALGLRPKARAADSGLHSFRCLPTIRPPPTGGHFSPPDLVIPVVTLRTDSRSSKAPHRNNALPPRRRDGRARRPARWQVGAHPRYARPGTRRSRHSCSWTQPVNTLSPAQPRTSSAPTHRGGGSLRSARTQVLPNLQRRPSIGESDRFPLEGVGPWSPMILVEMVPIQAGGDN